MEETRRRPGAGGGARGKGSRSGEGPAARRKEAAAAGSAAAMEPVAGLVRARSSVKWNVPEGRWTIPSSAKQEKKKRMIPR